MTRSRRVCFWVSTSGHILRHMLLQLFPLVGNLTAATHMETLKTFKITHILTLDSVPLPQHIVDSSFLTTKYVQSKCRAAEGYGSCIPIYIYIYLLSVADMPREDILQHLESCVEFIANALAQQLNVLVHW